jgi:RND family efflux transporter MFP subunit
MKRYMSFLAVAGLLIVSSCGGGQDEAHVINDSPPVAVRTAQAMTRFAEEPVQYSASIEPAEKASIAGKVMGKVERIYVTAGETVTKGQMLVKIQGEDIRARLAQAEAGVSEARAHFENAKKNLDRYESLFEEKAATQKELDDVRMGYESAQARLNAAGEMKKEVEELLQYVNVVAPFDGVITKTYVDVGDLATPGKPILLIENVRQLEVVASVPESQIKYLSVGMPVKIVIPARAVNASHQVFTGSVDQIVPSADRGSRQFEIKVFIQNLDGTVKSGMFARLVISRAPKERLIVPSEAVFVRGQLEGLFVVGEDGRAYLRWVRPGRPVSDGIEILSGLDPGEMVVTGSDSKLVDGQRVEVTN